MLQALNYWETFSMYRQQHLHFQQFKNNLSPFLYSSQQGEKKKNGTRRAVLENSKSLFVTYFAIWSSGSSLQLTISTTTSMLNKRNHHPRDVSRSQNTIDGQREDKGNHKVSEVCTAVNTNYNTAGQE